MKSTIITLGLMVMLYAPSAVAADLELECVGKQISTNGLEKSFKARLSMSFETKHVSIYLDEGEGYKPRYDGSFAKFDDHRIILSEAPNNIFYIDRDSKEFYEKTSEIDNGPVTKILRAKCEKRDLQKPAF